MFNPWFSLSLDAAQLAFNLTRIMVGGVSRPFRSIDIGEAYDAAAPTAQARVPVAQAQGPVAEVREGPAPVAIARDKRIKSATKPQEKPSRTKGRHASKRAARAAAPKRTAASLIRVKAIRRSARKKGK
jgi:hypothetical protein